MGGGLWGGGRGVLQGATGAGREQSYLNLLLQLQALLPEPLRSLPAFTAKLVCLQLQVSQLLLQESLLIGIVLLILTPACTGLSTSTRGHFCSQQ